MRAALWLAFTAASVVGACPCVQGQETSRVQVQGIQGQFMVDLAQDAQGRAWIATEEQGVWRRESPGVGPKAWRQFTTRDGLGDDRLYAVACDHQNRVWVGHLNHGVSVFDGQQWRNYPVGQGPIGERVFDIAVCPTDGDVWIATNCGLSRYSVAQDVWSAVTAADGAPRGAIQSLAFDAAGNLIAGTQHQGLAIGAATGGYRRWRYVSGPAQLPSDLITSVLVTREGWIYAATPDGLARSRDGGRAWEALRGRDAAAKAASKASASQLRPVSPANTPASTAASTHAIPTSSAAALEGASPPRPGAPTSAPPQDGLARGTVPSPAAPPRIDAALLREDYVTCLAQDGAGRLWIGYRREGYEVRDAQRLDIIADSSTGDSQSPAGSGAGGTALGSASVRTASGGAGENSDFVRAILPRRSGEAPLVAYYGRGVEPAVSLAGDQASAGPAVPPVQAPLPSPAGAPDPQRLNALLREIEAVTPYRGEREWSVAALDDDWSTQGDWLGRYGRYQAVLGAMLSPHNYVWGAGEAPVPYDVRIGDHRTPGDSLRYWIQWLYTSTPESLEMPAVYYHARVANGYDQDKGRRRQSEWDDHREEYPMDWDGPRSRRAGSGD